MQNKNAKKAILGKRSIAFNTILNLIGQIIPIAVAFFSIPILLSHIGKDLFGILSLVWVVLGYFLIFDFGVSKALTKFIAEELREGEESNIAHLFWTTITFQIVISAVLGLAAIFIMPILVKTALKIPPEHIAISLRAFSYSILLIPISMTLNSLFCVLEAIRRFDILNIIKIPTVSSIYCIPLICVYFNYSIDKMILSIVFFKVIVLSGVLIITFKLLPLLKKPVIQKGITKKLLSYGGWVAAGNLFKPFYMYFDRMIIGSMISMAAVTYYTAPSEIVIRLQIIPTSLILVLFPTFSSIGLNRKEELQQLFIKSTKFLLIIVGFAIVLLIIFSKEVLLIWLGKDFLKNSGIVMNILLIGSLVGIPAGVSNSLLQGIGRPDLQPKVYAAYAPIALLALWALVDNFGIIGAAIYAGFRSLFDMIIFFLLSLRVLMISFDDLKKNLFIHLILMLLGFATVALLIGGISSIMLKIVLAIIFILSYPLCMFFFGMNLKDRKDLASLGRRLYERISSK